MDAKSGLESEKIPSGSRHKYINRPNGHTNRRVVVLSRAPSCIGIHDIPRFPRRPVMQPLDYPLVLSDEFPHISDDHTDLGYVLDANTCESLLPSCSLVRHQISTDWGLCFKPGGKAFKLHPGRPNRLGNRKTETLSHGCLPPHIHSNCFDLSYPKTRSHVKLR